MIEKLACLFLKELPTCQKKVMLGKIMFNNCCEDVVLKNMAP